MAEITYTPTVLYDPVEEQKKDQLDEDHDWGSGQVINATDLDDVTSEFRKLTYPMWK